MVAVHVRAQARFDVERRALAKRLCFSNERDQVGRLDARLLAMLLRVGPGLEQILIRLGDDVFGLGLTSFAHGELASDACKRSAALICGR